MTSLGVSSLIVAPSGRTRLTIIAASKTAAGRSSRPTKRKTAPMFSTASIAHSRCYTTFKLRGRNTCYSRRRFRATAVATAKAADETKRASTRPVSHSLRRRHYE